MSLSPYFKSVFTDLTGATCSSQWYGQCADFENRALDCLEAYGLTKGAEKCEALLKDFYECTSKQKQHNRALAMRYERNRQYYAGERKKENLWAPGPQADAY